MELLFAVLNKSAGELVDFLISLDMVIVTSEFELVALEPTRPRRKRVVDGYMMNFEENAEQAFTLYPREQLRPGRQERDGWQRPGWPWNGPLDNQFSLGFSGYADYRQRDHGTCRILYPSRAYCGRVDQVGKRLWGQLGRWIRKRYFKWTSETP